MCCHFWAGFYFYFCLCFCNHTDAIGLAGSTHRKRMFFIVRIYLVVPGRLVHGPNLAASYRAGRMSPPATLASLGLDQYWQFISSHTLLDKTFLLLLLLNLPILLLSAELEAKKSNRLLESLNSLQASAASYAPPHPPTCAPLTKSEQQIIRRAQSPGGAGLGPRDGRPASRLQGRTGAPAAASIRLLAGRLAVRVQRLKPIQVDPFSQTPGRPESVSWLAGCFQ